MTQVIATLALTSALSLPTLPSTPQAMVLCDKPMSATNVWIEPDPARATRDAPYWCSYIFAQLSRDEHERLRLELRQRPSAQGVRFETLPQLPRSGLSFRERQRLRRQLREQHGPPESAAIHAVQRTDQPVGVGVGVVTLPELAIDDAVEINRPPENQ